MALPRLKKGMKAGRVRRVGLVRAGDVVKIAGTKKSVSTMGQRIRAARERAAASREKFVLVYNGVEDPDPNKVQVIIKALAPATVKEVLPGTLSVEGNAAKITRKAKTLDSWSLSSEGRLSGRSPSETRFDIPPN